jgi:hypothetical protein
VIASFVVRAARIQSLAAVGDVTITVMIATRAGERASAKGSNVVKLELGVDPVALGGVVQTIVKIVQIIDVAALILAVRRSSPTDRGVAIPILVGEVAAALDGRLAAVPRLAVAIVGVVGASVDALAVLAGEGLKSAPRELERNNRGLLTLRRNGVKEVGDDLFPLSLEKVVAGIAGAAVVSGRRVDLAAVDLETVAVLEALGALEHTAGAELVAANNLSVGE